jgi:coenzyme PQQ biosynthesis protein A
MTWTTPTLVEICIGLEINGYLPAEFWYVRTRWSKAARSTPSGLYLCSFFTGAAWRRHRKTSVEWWNSHCGPNGRPSRGWRWVAGGIRKGRRSASARTAFSKQKGCWALDRRSQLVSSRGLTPPGAAAWQWWVGWAYWEQLLRQAALHWL